MINLDQYKGTFPWVDAIIAELENAMKRIKELEAKALTKDEELRERCKLAMERSLEIHKTETTRGWGQFKPRFDSLGKEIEPCAEEIQWGMRPEEA